MAHGLRQKLIDLAGDWDELATEASDRAFWAYGSRPGQEEVYPPGYWDDKGKATSLIEAARGLHALLDGDSDVLVAFEELITMYEWYRRDNRREYQRRRYRENPEFERARGRRRIERQKALPNTLTKEQWQQILDDYDHRCAYCGARQSDLDYSLHQEHVIPVVQDGGHTADNVVPACKSCNAKKGARTPEQAGMKLHRPQRSSDRQNDD